MTRALLAVAALLVAGCGTDDAPAADTSAADASAPVTVRGVVVETLYDGAALRVDHEAVPTLGMVPMRMAFPLDEPSLADGLAPGDKVALTIEAAPRLRVTSVEALPAETPLTLAPPPGAGAPDSLAARAAPLDSPATP